MGFSFPEDAENFIGHDSGKSNWKVTFACDSGCRGQMMDKMSVRYKLL